MPLLTHDVHYLQYLPALPHGADDSALPPPRFASCPFEASASAPSPCRSVAPFPQEGDDVAPAPPPAAPDAPSLSFSDCSPELQALAAAGAPGLFQLRVYRSADAAVAKTMGVTFNSQSSAFALNFRMLGGSAAGRGAHPAARARRQ